MYVCMYVVCMYVCMYVCKSNYTQRCGFSAIFNYIFRKKSLQSKWTSQVSIVESCKQAFPLNPKVKLRVLPRASFLLFIYCQRVSRAKMRG